ncbi:MAG TPA: tetratricopeptide repeat protein, partial [Lentisphaerae bacterium]|nr:tetratricopeptide repeat protein [Lentisphaerota bacterium]
YSLGRKSAALALLRKAVEFAPRDRDLLIELGLLLRFDKQFEEASEVFERALRIDPDSRVAKVNVELLQRRLSDGTQ